MFGKTMRLLVMALAVVGAAGLLATTAYAVEGSLPSTATPDNDAPVVTATVRAVAGPDGRITISATDAAPGWGVAYIGYRLNGASARLYRASGMASDSTSASISSTAPGTQTVEYWAQDRAGNISAAQTLSFKIKRACALSFTAPATSPFAAASVSGRLTNSSGAPLAGRSVQIMAFSDSWKPVATVKTGSDGKYTAKVAPTIKTDYKAFFAGDSVYADQASVVRSVLPQVRIQPTSTWKTASLNTTYSATGYVEPPHAVEDSNTITIRAYRKGSDGVYRYVTSFAAQYIYFSETKTSYTAAVRFTKASWKGSWKLVPYHAADLNNAKTLGPARYVTVK